MEKAMEILGLLDPHWQEVLAEELKEPYIDKLFSFVDEEYEKGPVYPPKDKLFTAFALTSYESTNVVIMGQDPYHGRNQAHGLCFSVQKGTPIPPSLQNIYKEIRDDLGIALPKHGCLTPWAAQGILMLNATMSVKAGKPKSHYGLGWERFTDAVIKKLSQRKDPVIFVLWGKSAQEKCLHVLHGPQIEHHFLLMAAHPSPYSANNGFFGCRHFSKINELLARQGKLPIDWEIR